MILLSSMVVRALSSITAAYEPAPPPATLSMAVADVQLFGTVMGAFTDVFLNHNTSLGEALETLSMVAHALMVLYYHHGTAFLPGQTYHAVQSTIKDIYVTTAIAQEEHPGTCFYYFLAGTNELEKLFAIFRTITHSGNFDMLQLGERAASAAAIAEIMCKRPEWNRIERRLNPESEDKVNLRSWTGSLSVDGIVLETRWSAGRDQAIRLLGTHPVWATKGINSDWFRDRHSEKLTVMRPKGKLVGVAGSFDEEDEGAEGGGDGDSGRQPPEGSGLLEEMLPEATESGGGEIRVSVWRRSLVLCLTLLSFSPPATRKIPVPQPGPGSATDLVHAAVALRMCFSGQSLSKSSERLRRVRSEGHSAKAKAQEVADCSQEQFLHVLDPVAVLVVYGSGSGALARAKGEATVVVGQVKRLCLYDGESKSSVLSVSEGMLRSEDLEMDIAVMAWKKRQDLGEGVFSCAGECVGGQVVRIRGGPVVPVVPFNPDMSSDFTSLLLSLEDLGDLRLAIGATIMPAEGATVIKSLPVITGHFSLTGRYGGCVGGCSGRLVGK